MPERVTLRGGPLTKDGTVGPALTAVAPTLLVASRP